MLAIAHFYFISEGSLMNQKRKQKQHDIQDTVKDIKVQTNFVKLCFRARRKKNQNFALQLAKRVGKMPIHCLLWNVPTIITLGQNTLAQ